MFLVPALLLPFLLGLALYRLFTIPRRLATGQLRLRSPHRKWRALAAWLAYLMLLGTTFALGWALSAAVFFSTDAFSAYLSLAGYVLAYPLAYMASAWLFFHAFEPVAGRPSG